MKKRLMVLALMPLLFSGAELGARQLAANANADISGRLKELRMTKVIVDLNVRIPVTKKENPLCTRDCTLWGTLIMPEGNAGKKNPTILVATGYRREICMLLYLNLVAHGYNLLAIDVRGTGSTADSWFMLEPVEWYDVKYVIDGWIPRQPWSDGKVGMIGASYMGLLQLLAAGIVDRDPATGEPAHLKAIMPMATGTDTFRDLMFHGGNLDIEFPTGWMIFTELVSLLPPMVLLGDTGMTMEEAVRESLMTFQSHLEGIQGILDKYYFNPQYSADMDNFYSRSPILFWPDKPSCGWPGPDAKKTYNPKLPMFITTGWRDIFTQGVCNNYRYGLAAHANGDKALVIGDWNHFSAALNVGFPTLMNMAVAARWFNWKIRGEEDCFLKQFPVLIRVMGAERWRAEKAWPLPASRVERRALFLSKEASEPIAGDWYTNDRRNNLYSLTFLREAVDYDSEDPVMEHSLLPDELHGLNGGSFNRWAGGLFSFIPDLLGMFGIRTGEAFQFNDDRRDEIGVPTFSTGELGKDLEITGPLTLTFWARTEYAGPLVQYLLDRLYDFIDVFCDTKSNTLLSMMKEKEVQWVAELHDVYPDGRANNITSGWLRSSWRQRKPKEPASRQEHPLDPSYVPHDPFYTYLHRKDRMPIREHELYQYAIELWPTSNVFKKGHRIRLSLSGSDFPHLLPVLIPSRNTIVIDERHPAKLEFTSVNGRDEGETWRWIDDPDEYLAYGKDDCGQEDAGGTSGSGSGPVAILFSGCVQEHARGAGTGGLVSGMAGLLIPFMLGGMCRGIRRRRKRV